MSREESSNIDNTSVGTLTIPNTATACITFDAGNSLTIAHTSKVSTGHSAAQDHPSTAVRTVNIADLDPSTFITSTTFQNAAAFGSVTFDNQSVTAVGVSENTDAPADDVA